jgi:hypothetical protein
MAEHETEYPEMDYSAHNATYAGFVGGVKNIVITVAVILILMAAFL